MAKGTKLFHPPTARDCVEAAAELAKARVLVWAIDNGVDGISPEIVQQEIAVKINNAIDLLAAIAGDREVGVSE